MTSIFVLVFTMASFAQEDLHKKVSFSFEQSGLVNILDQIDAIDGVTLSYDPGIIENRILKARNYHNKPVKAILEDVLGENYKIQSIGGYIIIQPKSTTDQEKVKEKMENQVHMVDTVKNYTDSLSKTKATRSEQIPDNPVEMTLQESFYAEDTAISQVGAVPQESLPTEVNPTITSDSLAPGSEETDNPIEVRDQLFQASLLPGIGTSGYNSQNVRISYSFNLLGGSHYGLSALEIGLIYNHQRERMNGFQLAGISNSVGRQIQGLQVAGAANLNRANTTGWQIAGFSNINLASVTGLQIASGFNVSADSTKGAQIALGSNVAVGSIKGAQLSLGANITTGNHRGAQLAGGNIAVDSLSGVQVAGLFNLGGYFNGLQLSAFSNISLKHTRGAQIAPLNYSKRLRGFQLGLINMVDSLEKGVTIGLLNFVKNGKVEIGFESNDVEHIRTVFRTGVNSFYNIYSAGIHFFPRERNEDHFLWSYGLGFGTQKKINSKVFTNLELSSTMIHNSRRKGFDLNLLNRVHWNLGVQMLKWVSVTGGPVLNVLVTELYDRETDQLLDFPNQRSFYKNNAGSVHIRMWLGYAFSLNF